MVTLSTKWLPAQSLTFNSACRRSDPADCDRNLFYLLLRKDGSTHLPALDAVFNTPQQPSLNASLKTPSATLPPSVLSAAEHQQFAGLSAPQQPHNAPTATSASLLTTHSETHQQTAQSCDNAAAAPVQSAVHKDGAEPATQSFGVAPPVLSSQHVVMPEAESPQALLARQLSTLAEGERAGGSKSQAAPKQHQQGAAPTDAGPLAHVADNMLVSNRAELLRAQPISHPEQPTHNSEHKQLTSSSGHQLPGGVAVQAQDVPLQPVPLYQYEQHSDYPRVTLQQPVPAGSPDVEAEKMSPALAFLTAEKTEPSNGMMSNAAAQGQSVLASLEEMPRGFNLGQQAPVLADASDHAQPAMEQPCPELHTASEPDAPNTHQAAQAPTASPAAVAPCASPTAASSPLLSAGPHLAAVTVVSPRQADLRGVLGLACSQIIARQQARSPSAFPHHQSPHQASPAQASLSTSPVQHQPQETASKAERAQPGACTARSQSITQAVQQKHVSNTGQDSVHSPVQHALPSTAQQAQQAQQGSLLPAQLQQAQLSQVLENEWTSMLIDQPDNVQPETAQLPPQHPGEQSAAVLLYPSAKRALQHDPVQPALSYQQLSSDQLSHDDLQTGDVELRESEDSEDAQRSLTDAAEVLPSTAEPNPPPVEARTTNAQVAPNSLPGNKSPANSTPVLSRRQGHESGADPPILDDSCPVSSQPRANAPHHMPLPDLLDASFATALDQDIQLVQQQPQATLPLTASTMLDAKTHLTHHALQGQHDQQMLLHAPVAMMSAIPVGSSVVEQPAQHAADPRLQQAASEHATAHQKSSADQAQGQVWDSMAYTAGAERPHTRSTRHISHHVPALAVQAGSQPVPAEPAVRPVVASLSPEVHPAPEPKTSKQPSVQAEPLDWSVQESRSAPERPCTRSRQLLSEAADLKVSDAKQAADEPMQTQAVSEHLCSEQHGGQPDDAQLQSAMQAALTNRLPCTRSRKSGQSDSSKQAEMSSATADPQSQSQISDHAPSQTEAAVIGCTADALQSHKPHVGLRRSSRGATALQVGATEDSKSAPSKRKQNVEQKSPPQQQNKAKHAQRASNITTVTQKQLNHQQPTRQSAQMPLGSNASRNSNGRIHSGKRNHSELYSIEEDQGSEPAVAVVKLKNSSAKNGKSSNTRSEQLSSLPSAVFGYKALYQAQHIGHALTHCINCLLPKSLHVSDGIHHASRV